MMPDFYRCMSGILVSMGLLWIIVRVKAKPLGTRTPSVQHGDSHNPVNKWAAAVFNAACCGLVVLIFALIILPAGAIFQSYFFGGAP